MACARAASALLLAALALQIPASATAAGAIDAARAGASPDAVACIVEETLGDRQLLRCPIDGSTAPQTLRFRADFSGGHDDTMASLAVTLDDAPIDCDPGSKTRLMGEDGDVFLECRLTLGAFPGAARSLGVTLRWSHAEYTRHALRRD